MSAGNTEGLSDSADRNTSTEGGSIKDIASHSGKIAVNSAYLFLGQVISLGFSLGTFVLLARYLGEETLGVFSYGLVIVGFFSLLPDFGMKPILVREASRSEKTDEFLSHAFTIKLCLSVIAVAGMLGYSQFFHHDPRTRLCLSVLSLTILLSSKSNSIRSPLESMLNARLESKAVVISQLLDFGFQFIITFILIKAGAGIAAILLGYVLPNAIGLVYLWLRFAAGNSVPSIRFDVKRVGWILKESFPLLLYLLVMMFVERFDVFLIRHFCGDASLGVYSGAYRLVVPLSFVPFAITYSLFPVFSGNGTEKSKIKYFSFGLEFLFMLGLLIAAGTAALGEEMFLVLFGGKFQSIVPVFQQLVIGQIAFFTLFYLIDYFNSQNRQSVGLRAVAVSMILSVPLQVLLIWKIGVAGAGFSKIATYTINLTVMTIIVWKHLPPDYRTEWVRQLARIVASMIILLAVVLLNAGLAVRLILMIGAAIWVLRSRAFRQGIMIFKRIAPDAK